MAQTYERPSVGTATRRVWDIADELSRETGTTAERSEVIRQYEAQGGNQNTASTQYHHWKKHREATVVPGPRPGPAFVTLQVKEAGRVLLPADVRALLGVSEGEALQGVIEDGELRLMSRATAVRRAQAMVRRRVPRGVSLVDDLLADRRAENARESRR